MSKLGLTEVKTRAVEVFEAVYYGTDGHAALMPTPSPTGPTKRNRDTADANDNERSAAIQSSEKPLLETIVGDAPPGTGHPLIPHSLMKNQIHPEVPLAYAKLMVTLPHTNTHLFRQNYVNNVLGYELRPAARMCLIKQVLLPPPEYEAKLRQLVAYHYRRGRSVTQTLPWSPYWNAKGSAPEGHALVEWVDGSVGWTADVGGLMDEHWLVQAFYMIQRLAPLPNRRPLPTVPSVPQGVCQCQVDRFLLNISPTTGSIAHAGKVPLSLAGQIIAQSTMDDKALAAVPYHLDPKQHPLRVEQVLWTFSPVLPDRTVVVVRKRKRTKLGDKSSSSPMPQEEELSGSGCMGSSRGGLRVRTKVLQHDASGGGSGGNSVANGGGGGGSPTTFAEQQLSGGDPNGGTKDYLLAVQFYTYTTGSPYSGKHRQLPEILNLMQRTMQQRATKGDQRLNASYYLGVVRLDLAKSLTAAIRQEVMTRICLMIRLKKLEGQTLDIATEQLLELYREYYALTPPGLLIGYAVQHGLCPFSTTYDDDETLAPAADGSGIVGAKGRANEAHHSISTSMNGGGGGTAVPTTLTVKEWDYLTPLVINTDAFFQEDHRRKSAATVGPVSLPSSALSQYFTPFLEDRRKVWAIEIPNLLSKEQVGIPARVIGANPEKGGPRGIGLGVLGGAPCLANVFNGKGGPRAKAGGVLAATKWGASDALDYLLSWAKDFMDVHKRTATAEEFISLAKHT